MEHLTTVLELLRSHQFVAKRSKCLFGQTTIDYLGHVISNKGLRVDPCKIIVIQQWLVPKSVKDVRVFLGLTGYCQRFIQIYASVGEIYFTGLN